MAELTWRRSFLLAAVVLSFAAARESRAGQFTRALATLDGAEDIQVPAGHKVVFAAYAEGVRIYRWNGTSCRFVRPEAALVQR